MNFWYFIERVIVAGIGIGFMHLLTAGSLGLGAMILVGLGTLFLMDIAANGWAETNE